MSVEPGGPVVFLGAGAVGSYAGAMLAATGIPVVLIDGWPEHVESMRARGLEVHAPEGSTVARPEAWHLGEAYRLRNLGPAAAFLTAKLYDTQWCAELLATWLPAEVPVLTMQNGLVEQEVARIVGEGRTLGVIAGGLDVALSGPGVVRRSRLRRAGTAPVFKVGELDGRITPRAERIAALLDRVDRAAVTADLYRERWVKLCANAMTTGLSGLTGLSLREVYTRRETQAIAARLGAEVLTVAAISGFRLPSLFGLGEEVWQSAARNESAALDRAGEAMLAQAASMTEAGQSGTLQDLLKHRPTEVEYFNGFVAREGARLGCPAPAHAIVAAMIREVEAGRRAIAPEALAEIGARLARISL